jgi:hypothetical protein
MHNRPKISDLFVRACQKLPNTDILAVVTDTDIESQLVCKKHGVNYIRYSNNFLGKKWNAGISHALAMKPDYVVISGDDDILTQSWYDTVLPYMKRGEAFGGLDSCYVLKYGNDYAAAIIRYPTKKILGCGAFIRADVFESVAKQPDGTYKLWDDHRQKVLDKKRDERFAEAGYPPTLIRTDKPTMIDIKSEQNIWSFDKIFRNNWAQRCTFEEAISIMPDL